MDDIDRHGLRDQPHGEWLSSVEATELLGVKPATLYTYVSRGLVGRVPSQTGRGSRYSRADVLRLRDRKESRSASAAAPGGPLRWGQPVIDTEVGAVDRRGPIYRGALATDLAERGVLFEWVVDRLLGVEHEPWNLFARAPLRERRGGASTGFLDRMLAAITAAGADDPHRHVPGRDASRVRQVLGLLASCIPGIAEAPRPDLDRALVLVADHGLNASTLSARVTASTGADLYACVISGLATLSGPRHGGAGARVGALLAECQRRGSAEALRDRLGRGESLPGFGHPLYPEGDPRFGPLLALAQRLAPSDPTVLASSDLARAAIDAGYQQPNLDLGLVTASSALGLGPEAAIGLFALGRAAGWMAHALEQQAAGWMLRPRSRYVGPTVTALTE